MRLIFLGPPGAGKGTQARELARQWGVPQIATGDMLREAIAARTALGMEAKRYYDRGELVPDDVIVCLIGERLRAADAAKGFILDGFPRTIPQAEALDRLLKELGPSLDGVIYFDVGEPELVRRLTGRRVCRTCGTTFHVMSAPPKRAGVCDRCGGELYQRVDDTEDTVRHRLGVYERQTSPLLAYYEGRGLLTRIAADGPIDEVRAAIRTAAEARR